MCNKDFLGMWNSRERVRFRLVLETTMSPVFPNQNSVKAKDGKVYSENTALVGMLRGGMRVQSRHAAVGVFAGVT